MAIFGSSNIFWSGAVNEGYDPEFGAAYDMAMESSEYDMAIIKSMYEYDMAEMGIATEGFGADAGEKLKEMWAKIREFFNKLWGAVKAFLARIIAFADARIKSDEDFVKKYEDQLKKVSTAGLRISMYNYTIGDKSISAALKNIQNAENYMQRYVADVPDEYFMYRYASNDEHLNNWSEAQERADNVALIGTDTAEDFTKAVYDKLRGGESKKSIPISGSAIIDVLKKTSEWSKSLKDAEQSLNKTYKKVSDYINKCADAANKAADSGDEKAKNAASKKAAMTRKIIGVMEASKNRYTKYISIYVKVMGEMGREYKKAGVKILKYKRQGE